MSVTAPEMTPTTRAKRKHVKLAYGLSARPAAHYIRSGSLTGPFVECDMAVGPVTLRVSPGVASFVVLTGLEFPRGGLESTPLASSSCHHAVITSACSSRQQVNCWPACVHISVSSSINCTRIAVTVWTLWQMICASTRTIDCRVKRGPPKAAFRRAQLEEAYH